ncbi:Gmad2 immunoglobulin-like domain-containing protein [Evansella sp. AB-P1]|uniref:Gmad2 immunoglobulin-like domain-containing protein n=1 Tax=Evansella sp. AB-P1 TaxID=3037653 RepID=UPI00241E1C8B|nr:Gmad2 immunoglobulin-like domain-containing protein [Evansella sp. AB-P1]MDG5788532.1 Gmad2 immunoglobulin-like domain-containing protein [Evansella sp. AB-P1]
MKRMLIKMTMSLLLVSGVMLTACSSNGGDDELNGNASPITNEDNQDEGGEQDSKGENDQEREEDANEPVNNDNGNDKTVDESNLSPTPEESMETHEVVLYFSDHDLMGTYRLKTEVEVRNKEELAKAALEAWINGSDHDELTSLIYSGVIIEYVEEVDGVAHVSFSKEIQESNLGSTGELMFAEQLAMIMEQFGYEQTQILVEGRVGESLLGHLYTGEPIVAKNPESYLWVEEIDSRDIVLQNVAFRIFEPAPNAEVKDQIVVRGLARTFEGTILYEFEDGHFILDEGFTTASEGAPGWGEFEIVIELDDHTNYHGRVFLFEESAKDGSRINELSIPVYVTE